MQYESVKQSLLLWAAYNRQLEENSFQKEKYRILLEKVQKELEKAGVTNISILLEILGFCTLRYTQEGTVKTEQFSNEDISGIC